MTLEHLVLAQLAEAGDISAMVELAKLYANSDGVTEDEQQAYRWYLRAAEAGNAEAQYSVGINLFTGRGAEANTSESVRWLKEASRNGFVRAASDLDIVQAQFATTPEGLRVLAESGDVSA